MIVVAETKRPDGKIICTVNWQHCSKELFQSEVLTSEEEIQHFMKRKIQSAIVDTLVAYINQRCAAYENMQVKTYEMGQELAKLRIRFGEIQRMPLAELMRKVVQDRKVLMAVLPPPASSYRGWIDCIKDLISFCETQTTYNHGKLN